MYRSNTPYDKETFINTLESIGELLLNQPWIVGGDFNIITSLEEKKGGIRKLDKDNIQLKEVLQTSNWNT